MDEIIESLRETLALKDETRTGWELRGVEDPESVAAHSWGVAYLVVSIGETFESDLPAVDLDAALRLAVVHDVAEARTGDVPTRADPSAAAELPDAAELEVEERQAMVELAGPLPGSVADDWERYERRESPEAVLVKELDLIEMCLQAWYYERGDRYDPAETGPSDPDAFEAYDALDEFFETARSRLQTATGRRYFDRIRKRYVDARDSTE
ncbi:HD domain-containing protein [Halopenitus sp. H-Gu1]|uniref:HD domain-containing protein n=1 Tax=Halopenitus sp. H-Gu1 TaxID=3242697 RepID=UPI00359DB333